MYTRWPADGVFDLGRGNAITVDVKDSVLDFSVWMIFSVFLLIVITMEIN